MVAKAKKQRYTLEIEAPVNGRIRAATVIVRDAKGKTCASDQGNLSKAAERRRVGRELARQLGQDKEAAKWVKAVEDKWTEIIDKQNRIREQAAMGSPEAVDVERIELLDTAPPAIRRPLVLIDQHAYAASWLMSQHTVSRRVDPQTGNVTEYDPPLVTLNPVLIIVRDDGQMFTDADLPDARRLCELCLDVRLPSPVPPGREWSGAGVKRFLAGKRPNPIEVFRRVVSVVDRFIDFSRSLGPQKTMCELVACFVVSSYFLDALNVAGYLWPNGDKGSGKTSLLQVVAELAFLGQVILAGSSYPCLRDQADYGATMAFDDAEAVMDTRRTDPDKRTLLLAGSRRGATVAVKELVGDKWVTRHVNTFCLRLFSAIRPPDEVLGSRSIMIPLVRSGDPRRSKANPMDSADWPTDRLRLIDDLWVLGLAHLNEIPEFDRIAAANASLCGRNLDPWRPILAVAAWLEKHHGVKNLWVKGLFRRMERLSVEYQTERAEIEDADKTRVLLRALLRLSVGWEGKPHTLLAQSISDAMNGTASEEDLAEPGKPYMTPRRVGWLLKRLRFRRPDSRFNRGKQWVFTRAEIETAARAYGVDVESETAFSKAQEEALQEALRQAATAG
jgi:hypothetical protein